ncbi:hypothetical protein BREV_BREV_02454 [Brevundimonas mediterranea]|uniref:Uncharacterized protein n=1 Tax=Brevundimonas mediterranea TaxID=74329 RepID=A0A7Z8Y5F4_9CAUL|nr:hypothetical protein BREV_BREV_02454 [Brevundimonas mediterranea]
MAAGWSPAGVYFVSSRKRPPFFLPSCEGRWGTQSAGAATGSSGVRRGPVTGANIGIFPVSRLKAAAASRTPGSGVCTGLAGLAAAGFGVEERFMNRT